MLWPVSVLVLVFTAVRLTAPATAPVTLFDVPARGSLAGDEAWLAGVTRLASIAHLPGPGHVAFAGDVWNARVALVLGRLGSGSVAVWLTGPEGAPPEEMTVATSSSPVDPSEPLALWDAPQDAWLGGLLVVVALPGDEVAVLAGRRIDASGQERPVRIVRSLLDGVDALPFRPPIGSSVRRGGPGTIVVTRDGATGTVAPLLSHRAQRVGEAAIDPADPRSLRQGVDERQLQAVLREMLATYGLPPRQLSPVLLAARPVGRDGARAILVGATLPSGATVAWLSIAGGGTGGPPDRTVATTPAPAGSALVDRVLAVPAGPAGTPSPLDPSDEPPRWLLVSAPPVGAVADVLGADDDVRVRLPLTAGAAIAAVPAESAAVMVRDAAGTVLTESPVSLPLR